MLRTMAGLVMALFSLALGASAAPLDPNTVEQLTRLPAEASGEVVRISLPRADIQAVVDGRPMQVFQGLTSWAAFQEAGDRTMVMGDIVLLEHEVNPALSAALDNRLEVTALHNHFFFDEPRVYFMHVGGTGGLADLARGVRAILDAAAKATKGATFPGPSAPAENTIEAAPLERILGTRSQTKDGMVKLVIGRTTTVHGATAGAAMGVNTWAVFAGSSEASVVDGDFAMRENEVPAVLRALRQAGINIVAIHNHMTHEEPRLVFLHFWGKGDAQQLAGGIRRALDSQGNE